MLPMDAAARSAAAKARQRLADAQGGFSDHLAMVEAFREWDMQGSPAKAAAYARANFVSAATMAMVSGMRKQVLQELQACPLANAVVYVGQNHGIALPVACSVPGCRCLGASAVHVWHDSIPAGIVLHVNDSK